MLFISRLQGELGSGVFGVVYKGLLNQPEAKELGEDKIEVAVKTIDSSATEEDKIKFLKEAAIMGQFIKHPNILTIMGIVSANQVCACMIGYSVKLSFWLTASFEYRALHVLKMTICIDAKK